MSFSDEVAIKATEEDSTSTVSKGQADEAKELGDSFTKHLEKRRQVQVPRQEEKYSRG